ncbi:MAG: hypothetical protein IJW21_05965 [Clostridia bacterium]|nr:hypothetical protein [Clostridia bacterium]
MKLKKFICLIISLAMIFSSIILVSASNVNNVTLGTVKVARFENAEQIHNKAASTDIVTDYDIDFSLGTSGIEISGVVENVAFAVCGTLATKNARNTTLAYTAIETNNNYDVLYISVDKEIEKNVFMNNFVNNISDYSNVIVLYMQDRNNDDYIMVEIYIEYDFVGNYIANNVVSHDEGLFSEMFSWFTNHIEAESETEQVSTYSVSQRTFKREYTLSSRTYYYHLKVAFNANISNLSCNGSSTSSAYVEVIESNILDEDGMVHVAFQKELVITNINILFLTIPNTIVTEQRLFGEGVGDLDDTLTFEIRQDAFAASQSTIVTGTRTYTGNYSFNGIANTTNTLGIRLTSSGYNDLTNRKNYLKMMTE